MQNLIYSNCFIEAIKLKFANPKGKIKWDTNCPSGGISFFFEDDNHLYRFRRKIRRKGNKSKILFIGYRVVENKAVEVVNTRQQNSKIVKWVNNFKLKVMSKEKEVLGYNHDLENTILACNLDEKKINDSYIEFVDTLNERSRVSETNKVSQMIEDMESKFSKREIAFIACQKIVSEAQTEAMKSSGSMIEQILENLKESNN